MREVMRMGAVEDGRHNRGPEGMGWGWGRVGQGQNMWVEPGRVGWGRAACEWVGTWADRPVSSGMGGGHIGRAGVSIWEAHMYLVGGCSRMGHGGDRGMSTRW